MILRYVLQKTLRNFISAIVSLDYHDYIDNIWKCSYIKIRTYLLQTYI